MKMSMTTTTMFPREGYKLQKVSSRAFHLQLKIYLDFKATHKFYLKNQG